MSLDFDRSPDGEPIPPATQQPVPVHQAPATTDQESPAAPSFTPKHAAGEPEPDACEPGPAAGELPDDVLPAAEPVPAEPAAAGLDGPLLSDTDELHASWQRIQGAFIDDPREAVADAAGLIEHVGQLLAGALRLRQRQLRALWDRDGMPDGVDYADSGSPAGTVSSGTVFSGEDRPAADGGPDTEQLRLLIRRYRALFNELCRP
jgi:hypothetical protein